MAAVDRISAANLGVSQDALRRVFSEAVWQWYEDHKDEVIIERRVLFLNVKIRIRDLKFLIERIAGPQRGF